MVWHESLLELPACDGRKNSTIGCLPSQVCVERNYAVFMKHPDDLQGKIWTLAQSKIEITVRSQIMGIMVCYVGIQNYNYCKLIVSKATTECNKQVVRKGNY